ncbi:GHKL domain-containing protein [Bacillus toyonensis]
MPEIYDESITHELITIVGNLIDNALEAVIHCKRNKLKLGCNIRIH